MAKKISQSVGKGGKNKGGDIKIVQGLLNGFSKTCGFKKLDVDGLIGPMTNGAIAKFQKQAVGMGKADSRVDPGGKSLTTLNQGPKKAAAEAKKEQSKKTEKKSAGKGSQEEAKGGAAKNGQAKGKQKPAKPQVKGDIRGLDKKFLAVLEAVSSHYNKPIVVETGKARTITAGDLLWQEWLNTLDRGRKDANLKKDDTLRAQLDDLYSNRKKREFMDLVSKNSKKMKGGSDAHSTGRAADIRRNTNSKVVAALATVLRQKDEGDVIHFDDSGKSLPRTITESMKKKWK